MVALNKYNDMPERLDSLSKEIVDAVFQVHSNLGAGFIEKVYEDCLCVELQEKGIAFSRQFPVPLQYKGKNILADFRLDLVVEDAVVLELKAVERILPVHEAQIYSYLKMSGLPLGFLVNFNVPLIKDGIRRFIPKGLRSFAPSREDSLDAGGCA